MKQADWKRSLVSGSHVVLSLVLFSAPASARDRAARVHGVAERRVEALLRSKHLVFTFGDDGVMTCLGAGVPEVDALVALGRAAIPALVSHLDDTRELPMPYMYGNYADRRVPLGMACFDILASIVADRPPIFADPDCDADSVRYCVSAAYQIDVEDFRMTKAGYRPTRRLLAVKRRWERALRAGRLRFAGCSAPPAE